MGYRARLGPHTLLAPREEQPRAPLRSATTPVLPRQGILLRCDSHGRVIEVYMEPEVVTTSGSLQRSRRRHLHHGSTRGAETMGVDFLPCRDRVGYVHLFLRGTSLANKKQCAPTAGQPQTTSCSATSTRAGTMTVTRAAHNRRNSSCLEHKIPIDYPFEIQCPFTNIFKKASTMRASSSSATTSPYPL